MGVTVCKITTLPTGVSKLSCTNAGPTCIDEWEYYITLLIMYKHHASYLIGNHGHPKRLELVQKSDAMVQLRDSAMFPILFRRVPPLALPNMAAEQGNEIFRVADRRSA